MMLFQKIREKGKDQKGFTLGELLIVVAIIGILVAISIPIFTNLIRKARVRTSIANTRTFYSVFLTEYIECQTYSYDLDVKITGLTSRDDGKWYWRFRDHNGNFHYFLLPADPHKDGLSIQYGTGTRELGWTNSFIGLIDGEYPWIRIIEKDNDKTKTYEFGTVPDWARTEGKEEPEEVGFEFDE